MTSGVARPRGSRDAAPTRTFSVTFPVELRPTEAAFFFVCLSHLHRPATVRRPAPRCTVELLATSGSLTYYVTVPAASAELVARQLAGVLPGVMLTPVTLPPRTWTTAVELRTSEDEQLLTQTALVPGVLGSFYGLAPGEALLVQLVLRPLAVASLASDEPVFQCVMRLAVAGAGGRDGRRAGRRQVSGSDAELLDRVLGAYRSLHIEPLRLLRPEWTCRVAQRAPARVMWPQTLSPLALVSAAALPVDSPPVPGLVLGRACQLPPDPAISAAHRRIARGVFLGQEQPLTLSPVDRTHHLYVVGPSGSGKSTLLAGVIADDIAEGYGVAVFDNKSGEADSLITRVLEQIPRQRLSDVVLYDVADTARPIGLNVLAGSEPYQTTSQVVTMFDRLFDFSSSTPRALDVLRSTVLTLALAGLTLCEVAIILEPGPRGQRFRDQVLPEVTNPELVAFWRWYQGLRALEQSDVAAPILRRLRSLLLYPQLRLSLGQATSGFDLDEVLAQNKILLVPLSKGSLGDELARLVGALVATKLWSAVQRRPAGQRPFFWHVDEFHELFGNLPIAAGEILAQSRGYDIGLTLAHQHIGQLATGLRQEIFANARSKVVFQSTHRAEVLAAELGEPVMAEDVESLGAYEVLLRLHTGHHTRPVVRGQAYPPRAGLGLGQAARAASRSRYGRSPEAVEAELVQRHEGRAAAPARAPDTTGPEDPVPPEVPEGWEPWA